jgi:hypothetical protein
MASPSVPIQSTEVSELPTPTPNPDSDSNFIQPAQTDKENVPISNPARSAPAKPEVDPVTPIAATKALPQVAEGEEKHDWEVVNASPSHSPSKDGVNEGPSVKGKAREREKSNNSTFGKDGKIGQKIDGVKKVLKSGVFGKSAGKTSYHLELMIQVLVPSLLL